MKVTRLGPTRPLLTASSLGGSGGTISPAVGAGLVPTSNGSNGWAWGSNVSQIMANGSNVLGPLVNFADGSNTSWSKSSNTLQVHVTGISSNPADDTYAWMPLTSVASNSLLPELVWDGDDSLIPTLTPL